MNYSGPILMTGDQIAMISGQPTNQGNPGDANFGMVMNGVTAFGGANDVYRLVWHNNTNTTATFFNNGQWWRLQEYKGTGDPTQDEDGWSNVGGYNNLNPKNDLVAGVGGGDEYIVLEATNGRHVLFDLRGGLSTNPTQLTYRGSDQETLSNPDNTPSEFNFATAYGTNAICFCAGTLIETDHGPIPIEKLSVGDLVRTLDHGLQPVRWIGRNDVSVTQTLLHPKILPVHVAAGAMGPARPIRDLWLSPQHRVFVRSKIVERMTGQPEALVAIKQLCSTPGITQTAEARAVTYLHLRLDHHELVLAEGLWAETLLLGPQALRGMAPAAREELALIFPDVTETSQDAVRPIMSGRAGRTMADRHARNGKSLTKDMATQD